MSLGTYYNHLGIGILVVLLVLLWRAISPHGADVDASIISVRGTTDGTRLGVCIYAPLGRDVLHGIFEIMMTERTVIEDRRTPDAHIVTPAALVADQQVRLMTARRADDGDGTRVSVDRVLIIADQVPPDSLVCVNPSLAP